MSKTSLKWIQNDEIEDMSIVLNEVQLAFAMTVEKSQRQSLDKIGMNFSGKFFTHGQAYVAFSRVSGFADVKVFKESKDEDVEKVYCENVVYEELLLESTQDYAG